MNISTVKAEIRCIKYAPNLVTEVKRLIKMGRSGDRSNIQLRLSILDCKFVREGKPVIAVYQWGRDCDQFESAHVSIIPATVSAYLNLESEMQVNAEGPCHMHVMAEAEYVEFESSWRDRAAEQMRY